MSTHHPFASLRRTLLASLPSGTGFCISVVSGTGAGETLRVESYAEGEAAPGRDWQVDTLVPIWSTGKGPAAATVLWALQDYLNSKFDLSVPITRFWPEWPHGGSIGELLSHRLGLAAADKVVPADNHAAVIHQLCHQPLNWASGAGHGYHPRTIGYLWDEVVRRLTGKRLAEVWRAKLADPLDLDLWFGLPAGERGRVAIVKPGMLRARESEVEFRKAFGKQGSLTHQAFHQVVGWNTIRDFNDEGAWECGSPAFGAVASAPALAKFYALLAGADDYSSGVFAPGHSAAAETSLSQEMDLVLLDWTSFSAGFQMDPVHPLTGEKLRSHYGPGLRAFGHPGTGGSMAFADPDRKLGAAIVLNGLEPGVFPNGLILETLHAAVEAHFG